jgi:hypothetical protein
MTFHKLDKMNRLPDIYMPPSVYGTLNLTETKDGRFLADLVMRNHKDDPVVYVFNGEKLDVISEGVEAAKEQARAENGLKPGVRWDTLEVFSNILAGMRIGLENVRASQAERDQIVEL